MLSTLKDTTANRETNWHRSELNQKQIQVH